MTKVKIRTRRWSHAVAAMVIFGSSAAHSANTNATGNCNIILGDIINSHISIQSNCTASQSGRSDDRTAPIQDLSNCLCTAQKAFVRRLEAEIIRMCQGVCELPGYERAYDMLARITSQVPACCHKAVLEGVTNAREVSCKVKLVSSAWLAASNQQREDVIEQAKQNFRENKMAECNRNF